MLSSIIGEAFLVASFENRSLLFENMTGRDFFLAAFFSKFALPFSLGCHHNSEFSCDDILIRVRFRGSFGRGTELFRVDVENQRGEGGEWMV